MSAFRMYKARGQPGCWYGYVEIDGRTYKIDARHVGERVNKHFEGTVKPHPKADQQKLPLRGGSARNPKEPLNELRAGVPPGLELVGDFQDDELPPF